MSRTVSHVFHAPACLCVCAWGKQGCKPLCQCSICKHNASTGDVAGLLWLPWPVICSHHGMAADGRASQSTWAWQQTQRAYSALHARIGFVHTHNAIHTAYGPGVFHSQFCHTNCCVHVCFVAYTSLMPLDGTTYPSHSVWPAAVTGLRCYHWQRAWQHCGWMLLVGYKLPHATGSAAGAAGKVHDSCCLCHAHTPQHPPIDDTQDLGHVHMCVCVHCSRDQVCLSTLCCRCGEERAINEQPAWQQVGGFVPCCQPLQLWLAAIAVVVIWERC